MTSKIETASAQVRELSKMVGELEAEHAKAVAMAEATDRPAPGALARFLAGGTEAAIAKGLDVALVARRRADEIAAALAEARQTLEAARAQVVVIQGAADQTRCKVLAHDIADLGAVLASQVSGLLATFAAHRAATAELATTSGVAHVADSTDDATLGAMRLLWTSTAHAKYDTCGDAGQMLISADTDIAACGRAVLQCVVAQTQKAA